MRVELAEGQCVAHVTDQTDEVNKQRLSLLLAGTLLPFAQSNRTPAKNLAVVSAEGRQNSWSGFFNNTVRSAL